MLNDFAMFKADNVGRGDRHGLAGGSDAKQRALMDAAYDHPDSDVIVLGEDAIHVEVNIGQCLAAAPLARRFGLLNTMVFTHLPSNILLMLVAFMPTFPLAGVTLLARQLLSQMDVPTRQAYTMALTPPEERTAAASVTSLARSAGSSVSPIIAGALLSGALVALGLPLLIGGGLKALYDLALWSVFRHVRPPDER